MSFIEFNREYDDCEMRLCSVYMNEVCLFSRCILFGMYVFFFLIFLCIVVGENFVY